MKKVLFATTALVAFAGAAAAEVSVGGDARMGLTYDDSRAQETTMDTRVRIRFTASGTTDGGLEWEAASRIRTGQEGGASVNAFNELGVTISGAFGSLTFGSESSAAEYAVGDLAGVGFGPRLVGNENVYLNTAETARALYSYSASGFTGYVSIAALGTDTYAIGAKYETNGLTLALGYEDADGVDHIIGGVTYAFGDTTLKGTYGTSDDLNFDQYGVSIAHKMGATTLKAYYRATETGGVDADFYGIGADYALGGGATLAGGIADRDGDTLASLGLKFSF